jgi:hypothetical protein
MQEDKIASDIVALNINDALTAYFGVPARMLKRATAVSFEIATLPQSRYLMVSDNFISTCVSLQRSVSESDADIVAAFEALKTLPGSKAVFLNADGSVEIRDTSSPYECLPDA